MKKQIIGNCLRFIFFFVDFVCVCVVGFLVGCGLFFVLVVKINTATDLTVIQVSTRQLAEEPSLKMAATHHFYHFSAGLKTRLGFKIH